MDGDGKNKIHFDWTFNLGHVLTVGSVLLAGTGMYYGIVGTLENHAFRITSMEKQVTSFDGHNSSMREAMWKTQADIAVIKDRLDRK